VNTADGAVIRRFFPNGFQDNGVSAYFYTTDHLGSTRDVTDTSGTMRAQYDYDPYGQAVKLAGDIDSSLLYAGHWAHAASGLLLAPYRAYDSNSGRWISPDPLGLVDGPNLYAHVKDNPVSKVDPSGLAGFPTIICSNIPTPNASTCCDGNGDFAVCMNQQTSNLLKGGYRQCVEEHESFHIARRRCKGETRCPGPRCSQPTSPPETNQQEECFGYWITYNCIAQHVPPPQQQTYQAYTLRQAQLLHNCNTTTRPWQPQ
jgi:RHS repeat-associated protein